MGMLFIGGKIIHSRLYIIAVKRRDGEKGRYLERHFKAGRMRPEAPVIDIVPVVSPQDDLIPQEIIQPQSDRQLEATRRQSFYRIGTIGKIDPMKRQTQVAMLFDEVKKEGDLQAGVNDLRKGKRRR